MTRPSLFAAVAAIYTVLAGPTAMAAPLTFQRLAPHPQMRGDWIFDGDFVLAPMRFIRFCIDNPRDCEPTGAAGIVALDDDAWQQLNLVNRKVNARIAPAYASAGRLDWSVTTQYGDCNDYAVQKRHELLALGWPSAALSLAVVMTASGEGHLVLTVRTAQGDVVLDNLRQKIVSWKNTGYTFVKRQSASSPRYWVEARGSRAVPDGQIVAIRSDAGAAARTTDNTDVRKDEFSGAKDNGTDPSDPAIIQASVEEAIILDQPDDPQIPVGSPDPRTTGNN